MWGAPGPCRDDDRNPANQLRLVVYAIHPSWLVGFFPSTVWTSLLLNVSFQKNIYDVVTDHYDFALFHIRLTMIFYSSSRLWRCVLFLVRCFQDLVLTLPMRVAMCCNSRLMEPLLLKLPQQFPNLAFTSLTQCMYFPYVFCCFVD